MAKHCGDDSKHDGQCQPRFSYPPPTPNLFFLVSSIVIHLTAFFLLPSTPSSFLLQVCLIPHIEAKSYTSMMFHRSQCQMEYMISSTSQPHVDIGAVPIQQMMKTEAKKDEITCLEPHSYVEAQARWWLMFFSCQLYKSQGFQHDNLHYISPKLESNLPCVQGPQRIAAFS